jgi:hypothetical protein
MITPNLAPDVSLPPMAALNPSPAPVPAPKSGDAEPQKSFAKLMGDQGQSSTASTPSATKAAKDDKKDKDKGSEKAAVPTVLPTVVMTMPIPPSPMPTIQKIVTTAGKASTSENTPSPTVQVPNVSVNTKNDVVVAAVAASAVTVPSDSKMTPVTASKPINKEAPEIKTPSQLEGKLTDVVASRSSSVDMSNDDSSSHHENRSQQQQPNLAPPPVSMPVPTTAGTGSAKQVAAMKLQEKSEGNVRTVEKNLPHGNFLPDNARSDGAETSPRLAAVPETRATPSSTISNTTVSALGNVVPDKTMVVETQTRIEAARSPQVDKALTEISTTAVSFKRIGTESVDVNLQPDRGTEINLHLSLSNGQVEVAARLERGNFDSLNTHWSDLQQSLGQQGIRVGQLEHSSLNQNLEGNQNRNQPAFTQTMQQELGGQRQRSSGPAPESSDEPVRTGTSAAPQRARSTSPARRGWEMWA